MKIPDNPSEVESGADAERGARLDEVGELAVGRGWVTPGQLDEARVEQEKQKEQGLTGEPLAQIFLRKRWIDSSDLRALLVDKKEDSTRPTATLVSVEGALGPYRIVREIARGGVGVVYEAIDTRLKRTVALKVVDGSQHKKNQIGRLKREATLAARLVHPGIVPIHEVGEAERSDGRILHYISMEYVEGQTLGEYIENLPLAARCRLLERVAEAVDYAHQCQIIHRDLKPGNILVTSEGRPVVVDFGLSKGPGEESMTRTGDILGTAYYMAPEQAKGQRKEISPATDVWSLGVILYEILCGQKPFHADTSIQMIASICREDPVPPSGLGQSVPRDLETICLKALEKSPGRRYADAGELAQDLARWRLGETIQARSRTPLDRIRLWAGPRASLLWGMLLGGGALIGVLVFSQFRLQRQEEETQKIRQEMLTLLRQRSKDFLDTALEFRRGGNLEAMHRYVGRAELVCRDAIEKMPALAEPHYRLGRMYRALMRDGEALAEQKIALRKEGNYAPALYERMVLRTRLFRRRVSLLNRDEYGRGRVRVVWLLTGPVQAGAKEWEHGPEIAQSDSEARVLHEGIRKDLEKLVQLPGDSFQPGQLTCAKGLLEWIEGRIGKALELLEHSVEENPQLEEGYEALSKMAIDENDFRQAYQWLSKGVELDRGYLPHRLGRGTVAAAIATKEQPGSPMAEEYFQKSFDDLSDVLKMDPIHAEALRNRGVARLYRSVGLSDLGRDTRSLLKLVQDDFDRAAELDPESAEIWLKCSLVREQWGRLLERNHEDGTDQFRAAIQVLERGLATESGRTNMSLHRERGLLLSYLATYLNPAIEEYAERFKQAIQEFDRVILERPLWHDVWAARAQSRHLLAGYQARKGADFVELYKKADADITKALEIDRGQPRYWSLRGIVRRNWAIQKIQRGQDPGEGLLRGSIEDVNRALQFEPNNGTLWMDRGLGFYFLAGYLNRKGMQPTELIQKALEDFERAVKLSPPLAKELGLKRENCRRILQNAGRKPGQGR
ncbi:MAG: protein kinase [Planctomycetota bacterium]|nr:protein kinase [Planctomycetota bacterium]